MRALWPFIRLMHGMARAVITAFGIRNADSRAMVHSEEELKMLVTASQEAACSRSRKNRCSTACSGSRT